MLGAVCPELELYPVGIANVEERNEAKGRFCAKLATVSSPSGHGVLPATSQCSYDDHGPTKKPPRNTTTLYSLARSSGSRPQPSSFSWSCNPTLICSRGNEAARRGSRRPTLRLQWSHHAHPTA